MRDHWTTVNSETTCDVCGRDNVYECNLYCAPDLPGVFCQECGDALALEAVEATIPSPGAKGVAPGLDLDFAGIHTHACHDCEAPYVCARVSCDDDLVDICPICSAARANREKESRP